MVLYRYFRKDVLCAVFFQLRSSRLSGIRPPRSAVSAVKSVPICYSSVRYRIEGFDVPGIELSVSRNIDTYRFERVLPFIPRCHHRVFALQIMNESLNLVRNKNLEIVSIRFCRSIDIVSNSISRLISNCSLR